MEKNLNIIGSTAIEDQLQDDVDKIIKSMMDTGMKIWMLTGDKLDTAKNIAISCKLFDEKMEIYEFKDFSNLNRLKSSLTAILRNEDFYHNDNQKGLLISSDVLLVSLESFLTSFAITRKPLPATPALAASMEALKESRFVCAEIFWMSLICEEIVFDCEIRL